MTETYDVSIHVSIMTTEEWSGQCGRVIFICLYEGTRSQTTQVTRIINNGDLYFYGLLLVVFGIKIFVFIY